MAVTENDLQFNPQGPSFGKCKLKPTPGGYLPCAYAPAGIWQKTYDKVKILGNSCVTEISELMCSTGGKITIMEHGQTSSMSQQNVKNADLQEQHNINPFVNFKEFQKETEDDEVDAY